MMYFLLSMRDKIVANYALLLIETMKKDFSGNPISLLDSLLYVKNLKTDFESKLINPIEFLKFNIKAETQFDKIISSLFKSKNYKLIDRIIDQFKSICSEKKILKHYYIFSTKEIDNSLKEKIEKALSSNSKFAMFTYQKDEKLLDGILIKENNEVLDLSLLKQINDLKNLLSKVH